MILFFKVFFTEFIAEMGDKTQLMLIALTSKYKLRDIILGTGVAILVLNGLAVLAGGLVSEFVPEWVIKMIAALAFLYFAASTIAGDDEEEEEGGKTKIKFAPLAVFCTFFVAELGDKTQLTAITFGGYAWYADRISAEEQDAGRAALHACICNLLHLRCVHIVSGAEACSRKRLSNSGNSGACSCDDCLCRLVCVPLCKTGEKEENSIR